MWISNSDIAKIFVVMANADPSKVSILETELRKVYLGYLRHYVLLTKLVTAPTTNPIYACMTSVHLVGDLPFPLLPRVFPKITSFSRFPSY